MVTRAQIAYRSRLFLAAAVGSEIVPVFKRAALLRRLGANVGDEVEIFGGCRFHHPERLTLGDRVFLNQGCLLDAQGGLTVETDVSIAAGVMLLSITHDIGGPERRASWTRPRPTVIGRGSWIGAGAIVLPGVTVAPACVIGAGAVVTKGTERDGVYIGNPARRVRELGS